MGEPVAEPGADARRSLRDGALLGLCAFAVYALLRQRTLHGDATALLSQPAAAPWWWARPLELLAAAVRPAGVQVAGAALLLAAAAGALGVAVLHRAATTLGLPRRAAVYATALTGACPAVLFFATTAHVHALLFLFAAVAFAASAAWASRPVWWRAVAAGAAAALASPAPGLGAWLPLLLVPWQWLERRERERTAALPPLPLRRQLLQSLLFCAVFVGLAALSGAARTQLPARDEWLGYDLATLLRIAGRDWLRAYLLLSLVWAYALCRSRWQQPARWLGAALAFHLVIGCHASGRQGDEGSFLLPFAFPCALLAVRALPRRALLPLLLLSLAVAVVKVRVHGDRERIDAFAAAMRAEATASPLVLLTDARLDTEALLVRPVAADRDAARLRVLVVVLPELARASAGGVDFAVSLLRAQHRAGRRLLLTGAGEDLLAEGARNNAPGLGDLCRRLEAEFVWQPRERDGCLWFELVPR